MRWLRVAFAVVLVVFAVLFARLFGRFDDKVLSKSLGLAASNLVEGSAGDLQVAGLRVVSECEKTAGEVATKRWPQLVKQAADQYARLEKSVKKTAEDEGRARARSSAPSIRALLSRRFGDMSEVPGAARGAEEVISRGLSRAFSQVVMGRLAAGRDALVATVGSAMSISSGGGEDPAPFLERGKRRVDEFKERLGDGYTADEPDGGVETEAGDEQ